MLSPGNHKGIPIGVVGDMFTWLKEPDGKVRRINKAASFLEKNHLVITKRRLNAPTTMEVIKQIEINLKIKLPWSGSFILRCARACALSLRVSSVSQPDTFPIMLLCVFWSLSITSIVQNSSRRQAQAIYGFTWADGCYV